MKKALGIISVLLIIAAGFQLWSVWNPTTDGGVAFSAFPQNVRRVVEVGWGNATLARGSARERRDQVRDWLLIAVVSNSGLHESDLDVVLADLPPARYGYLRPVGTFEYGDTRSRAIGDGRVIALVPAGKGDNARVDSLARIADEHRKNVGKAPSQLLVFEYEIAADEESAAVTRRPPVDGASLYTEAAGYYTATVNDTRSLDAFLSEVDELTEARTDSTLRLSGRRRRMANRVTVEDVAALWQSQTQIDAARREVDAKIDAFDARWAGRRYGTEFERQALEAERDREAAHLKAELRGMRAVDGSGFSLDPVYDYDVLSESVVRLRPLLESVAGPAEVSGAIDALQRKEIAPFLGLLYDARVKKANPLIVGLLREIQRLSQFQAARYDGHLQGTRVGMTLFYTDLLAKLKAIDYWDDAQVADFRSLTEVRVSRIYERELEELSSTRLWFGPQDRGYQLASDGILFGGNATRIYAASSDPLQPGKEAAPNARSQAFLGWWDDHFEEVAVFEPEYQRLNEIMKWSLVLSWLSEHNTNSLVVGLDRVRVTRDLWFPDWARANEALRYRDWSRFAFFPRAYKGTTTEAMPILYSAEYTRFGKPAQLSGGVSLGKPELIKSRGVLTAEMQHQELRLRPGLDVLNSTGPSELRMIGGLKHEFRTVGGRTSTVSSFTAEGVKSRAPEFEITPKPVERSYQLTRAGLDIGIKLDNADLGRFYSVVSPNAPIRIGFRAQSVERGQAFAERVSAAVGRGASADAFIASHPDVEAVVKYGSALGCDGCYAVKLRGVPDYVKLQLESVPSLDIPSGWQARSASLEPNARNINLAWIPEGELRAQLDTAECVVIQPAVVDGGASLPPTLTRGPPVGSPSEWNISGHKVPVRVAPDGTAYVRRASLPRELADWSALSRLRNGPPPAGSVDIAGFGGEADPRLLLSRVVKDPAGGRRALADIRKTAVSDIDAAIADGRFTEASRLLTQLQLLGEARPELHARRAVVAAASEDPYGAVRAIRRALSTQGDPTTSLTLIGDRLQHTGSGVEGQNLRQLAAMLDLGDARPFEDRGYIGFEALLAADVKATRVAGSSLVEHRGPVYVLDRPIADPYVAMFAAMPDQIARDLGTTVLLPSSDLAHARPQLIVTSTGKRYRLVEETRARPWEQSGAKGVGPYVRFAKNSPRCSTSAPWDGAPLSPCTQDVYLFDPPDSSTRR